MALEQFGQQKPAANQSIIPEARKPLMEALASEIKERGIPIQSSAIVAVRTMMDIHDAYQQCAVINMNTALFYKRHPGLQRCNETDLYLVRDICNVAAQIEKMDYDFDNEQQRALAYAAGQRIIVQNTIEQPITKEEVEALVVEISYWVEKYFPTELKMHSAPVSLSVAINAERKKSDSEEYLKSLPILAVMAIGLSIGALELYHSSVELVQQITRIGVPEQYKIVEAAIAVTSSDTYQAKVQDLIDKYK